MSFPSKFRHLLELTLNDVETPDYIWLTYAVCGVTADACAWNGWIVEGAFKKAEKRYPTATGDKPLTTSSDEQLCPRCGRSLFRTDANIRFEPSLDQTSVRRRLGFDYETTAMEYE